MRSFNIYIKDNHHLIPR